MAVAAPTKNETGNGNAQTIRWGEITISLAQITPEFAAGLLERNSHNRPINKLSLKQMKVDMASNAFGFNGDAIRVAADGTLLDGQHRLTACVQGGHPFVSLLVEGLPTESQLSMDRGKKRTFGEDLILKGIANGKKISPIVRSVLAWEAVGEMALSVGHGTAAGNAASQRYASLHAPRALFESDAERFKLSASWGDRLARRGIGSPSLLGTAFYLFHRVNEEDAVSFFEQLLEGSDLSVDSPIRALREKLIAQRTMPYGKRMPARSTMAVIVKAFNAWRNGLSLTARRLYWVPTREKFPAIEPQDWDQA